MTQPHKIYIPYSSEAKSFNYLDIIIRSIKETNEYFDDCYGVEVYINHRVVEHLCSDPCLYVNGRQDKVFHRDIRGNFIVDKFSGNDSDGQPHFQCPKCSNDEITDIHNFCPMCGIPITVKYEMYDK